MIKMGKFNKEGQIKVQGSFSKNGQVSFAVNLFTMVSKFIYKCQTINVKILNVVAPC